MKHRYIPPHLREGNSRWHIASKSNVNPTHSCAFDMSHNDTQVQKFSTHSILRKLIPHSHQYAQLCDHLISGFIRELEQLHFDDIIIPYEINQICYQFFIITDQPKFIIVNDEASYYSVNITSTDTNTKLEYLMDKHSAMSHSKLDPTCYVPNISKWSQSLTKKIIDNHEINYNSNKTYDGLIAVKSTARKVAGLKLFIYVFDRNNLFCPDKIKEHVSSVKPSRITSDVKQLLFCDKFGVFGNYSDKLFQLNLQNDDDQFMLFDYLLNDAETSHMQMLYLSHLESIFLIDNWSTAAIHCCLTYNLSNKNQNRISDYKISQNSNINYFKVGLCNNNVFKNKLFMVSNLGHVSEYHIQENIWINLKRMGKYQRKIYRSRPLVWTYDYDPNILYCIQSDSFNTSMKCKSFDIRDTAQRWTDCVSYYFNRFQRPLGDYLFSFL